MPKKSPKSFQPNSPRKSSVKDLLNSPLQRRFDREARRNDFIINRLGTAPKFPLVYSPTFADRILNGDMEEWELRFLIYGK